MANRRTTIQGWAAAILCGVLWLSVVHGARAQEPEPAAPAPESLDEIEARLAERYDRLELIAGRQAELSSSTQPRRAELLRQLIARGRERNVPGRFDDIIAALADESYSTAVDGQTQLQAELEKLLELLLQEDRDQQLESERKRVLRYLQDVNRLIRLQRGVKARTDGGDDQQELSDDQQRVGDETQKLREEMDAQEGDARSKPSNEPSEQNGDAAEDSQGEPSDSSEQDPSDEQERPDAEQPESGDEEESSQDDAPPGDETEEGDAPDSESPPPGEQQESEQQESDQPPGDQSGGQPSEGGQSGSSGQPQQQSPMQRAAESLKQAQQRMQQAQQRLEQAQREGAAEEQQRAVEELEQAKAEFERILRQLREEEMERMLVLLEARFRKMLDQQVAVYEETQKLDASGDNVPEHELAIAAGRLSRREELIVREADRALVLLREDGTSVAFPEAVEQARDDMQAIAKRLDGAKVDLLTQTMEEDVIAALEETLAALQQALEQVRQQQAQQSQGGGSPGEQPLVDQLAELRMIRTLQLRINRRTQQYGAMVEGEQAYDEDVLELLDELALRQAKIFQATRDLETGSNQ